MHYAKRMKREIEELQKVNLKLVKSIWYAQRNVLGYEDNRVKPFMDLAGNEVGLPLKDVEVLRKLILSLPIY